MPYVAKTAWDPMIYQDSDDGIVANFLESRIMRQRDRQTDRQIDQLIGVTHACV